MGILCLIVILFLPAIASQPQVFHEVIMEDFARRINANKSGELLLFWVCFVLGMALICTLAYKKNNLNPEKSQGNSASNSSLLTGISLIIIPIIIRFVILNSFAWFWIFLTAIYIYVQIVHQGRALRGLFLAILVYYSLIGFFSAVALFIPVIRMTTELFQIISSVISVFLIQNFVTSGSEERLNKFLLRLQ